MKRQRCVGEVSILQMYRTSSSEELAQSVRKKRERRAEKERLVFKGNVRSLKLWFKMWLRVMRENRQDRHIIIS